MIGMSKQIPKVHIRNDAVMFHLFICGATLNFIVYSR